MISKGKHSHKVKHGTIDNDMTSDKIPSDDEYFEQMLDEEESRSLPGQWIAACTVYFIFNHIFILTDSRPTWTGKRYDSHRG